MKTSIIEYLDNVIKALSDNVARVERPFDYVVLRTKIDLLNELRGTFEKHLPDEARAAEEQPPTPVEAEIVE